MHLLATCLHHLLAPPNGCCTARSPPRAQIEERSLLARQEVVKQGELLDGVLILKRGTLLVLHRADGARSAVRRLLVEACKGRHATPLDAPGLRDTGYRCVGGIIERGDLADGEPLDCALPFETLSRGARFALVPLSQGGAFWFATRQADAAQLRDHVRARVARVQRRDGANNLLVVPSYVSGQSGLPQCGGTASAR